MENEKLDSDKKKLNANFNIKILNRLNREQFRERELFDDNTETSGNELDEDEGEEFKSARSDPTTARHSLDSQHEGTDITFYDFDNYEYFALDLIRKEFEGFKVKSHASQTLKLSPQSQARLSTNTINYSTFNDSIESNQSDDTDFLFEDCILDSSDPFICESHLNLTFNACQNGSEPSNHPIHLLTNTNQKNVEKSFLVNKLTMNEPSFAESNLSFIIYDES
jgi:hypothetical protein